MRGIKTVIQMRTTSQIKQSGLVARLGRSLIDSRGAAVIAHALVTPSEQAHKSGLLLLVTFRGMTSQTDIDK